MKQYDAANAKAKAAVDAQHGTARERRNRSRSPLIPKTGKPAAKEPASASKRLAVGDDETESKKKTKNDEVNKRPGAEQPLGQKKQKKQAAE